MAFEVSGHSSSTEVENREHEVALYARRVTEVPSNMQMRADYDARTDSQPVYLGFGARSLATSSDGWIIYKFTYDGSDRITLRQTAYHDWDDRANGSYA